MQHERSTGPACTGPAPRGRAGRHRRVLCALAWAAALWSAQATAALPEPLQAALRRARLPPESLYLWIAPVGSTAPRLAHQAQTPVNPASLIKLVTAAVALDTLGPSFTWTTPAWLAGPVNGDVLQGSLVIEGRGDPRLVDERLWLLLRQVRQLGVKQVRGDIVLVRRAFDIPEVDPAEFDGEPHRPYNVRPDALSVNLKAQVLTFRPDALRGVARVTADPALQGAQPIADVPLSDGPCGDWRAQLQADLRNPLQLRFGGRFAAACGEKTWPFAPGEPQRFNARAIEAQWRALGGQLDGTVRDATPSESFGDAASPGVRQLEFKSPPLAEVLRDMNKYSNNVIAQHLFLTLGWARDGVGTWAAAREIAVTRVRERTACAPDDLRLDNGSGLSRDERITAQCLARVLQWGWSAPWMPEFVASLPIAGENTARRATSVVGRAHLKTGSLKGVAAVAGYVDAASGQRYVVVAILSHPQAGDDAGRVVLDEVLRWTAEERPGDCCNRP